MVVSRAPLIVALAGMSLAGCDPDTAVFVDASIPSAVLEVQQSSLSTAVAGTFIVQLHLGPRAAESSDVGLGQFSITDASGGQTLVPVLGFDASPPFPVTVDVDSTVDVVATLSPDDNLVEAGAIDALCAPEGVVVVGALDEELSGGTIDVASEPVTLAGCP